MPIDPLLAAGGAEWAMPPLEAPNPAAGSGGFAEMLSDSIGALSDAQAGAAKASQAFAAGTVSDPTEVVMAVERARLSMQLASQIRTKGVEAMQTVFQTQV